MSCDQELCVLCLRTRERKLYVGQECFLLFGSGGTGKGGVIVMANIGLGFTVVVHSHGSFGAAFIVNK
jgi:hypothetical protein